MPHFGQAAVSLSDVVLSTVPELHSAPRGALAGLLPVVPTSNREFPRSIRLSAFGRVYQKDGETPSAASLTAAVVNASGTEVAKYHHSLGPERFKSGGAEYTQDIPVSTLATGHYLLTVRATAGAATDTRHVRFTVD